MAKELPRTRVDARISAVWLRTIGNHTQVLVEQDGQWRIAINAFGAPTEQEISHIAEASHAEDWPIEDFA